jgi:hypothetical protein
MGGESPNSSPIGAGIDPQGCCGPSEGTPSFATHDVSKRYKGTSKWLDNTVVSVPEIEAFKKELIEQGMRLHPFEFIDVAAHIRQYVRLILAPLAAHMCRYVRWVRCCFRCRRGVVGMWE